MNKVITRIKGGIGNQLFCYAAARRLALVNNAEFAIDDTTGFVRDHLYHRRYMLDQFSIPVRRATPRERLAPFERYKRGMIKLINRNRPLHKRSYLEQEEIAFDPRLLDFQVRGTVYLDGYWQSELYFNDVSKVIRQDLQIIPPVDEINRNLAEKINAALAVAVHIRWFEKPDKSIQHNLTRDYYQRAFNVMEEKLCSPHYFIFSDDPDAARTKLTPPEGRTTFVSHNRGDKNAYADLWLMSKCKHFIIANSTFSWWGAWLSNNSDKITIHPNIKLTGLSAWGFDGLIPEGWFSV